MSGGRGTERRVMSDSVLVRLTPDAAGAVTEHARARGLSRAAWLRALAVAAAGLPVVERRLSRPVPRAALPAEDIAAVSRLAAAVGRAAGATIQFARALREAGAAEPHGEAEAVLHELRARQDDLLRVIGRLRGPADCAGDGK
jgi:hypothetical protein